MRYLNDIFKILSVALAVSVTVLSARPESKDRIVDTEESLLDYLYSTMSYPDSVAHSRDFYIDNIRVTLEAKCAMPWGDSVPEEEFLNFVLPLRVNNEDLDGSRRFLYDSIKERVKGMSMSDAILEVNHWCHERVTYQPSDARTGAPLSVISRATGRCGEESTLLVNALRAVGIPARQVYVPRWAHTDDNHAWVEAMADGKWYFLGACEPAPALNQGWFNSSAARSLLMHTKALPGYSGNEPVVTRVNGVTELNVTDHYTTTGNSRVKIVDEDGNPVENAIVKFCIYNYAEFYPVAKYASDKNGMAEMLTGLGDMLVWASDGDRYGFGITSPRNATPTEICLRHSKGTESGKDIDINVPRPQKITISNTDSAQAICNARIACEDSIRETSKNNRFVNPAASLGYSQKLNLPTDTMARVMTLARGNGYNILRYLESLDSKSRKDAFRIIALLDDKDMADVEMDVIDDLLPYVSSPYNEEGRNALISPRVDTERLTPCREFLKSVIPAESVESYRRNPQTLIDWAKKHIQITEHGNPWHIAMAPADVWSAKKSDGRSFMIFCVNALRTLGVPSVLNKEIGTMQYLDNDEWRSLQLAEPHAALSPSFGKLILREQEQDASHQYYNSFTLSRIENGFPVLMEFPEETTSAYFSSARTLPAGDYLLVTGTRQASGNVLAHAELFSIKDENTTERELIFRKDERELSVIGSLNAETLYFNRDQNREESLLQTAGRGYYALLLLKSHHEPSAHILNDISLKKDEIENQNIKIIALSEEGADEILRKDYGPLPNTLSIGIDKENNIARGISDLLPSQQSDRPVVVIADSFNRVVYLSSGYNIGMGEQLLHLFRNLD
ncbi:MAG: transglutaminase-like domain-containing protein [Muribaculum sp.]|nr:transglutaminase-like domain-containing protein [Muribaculum sp.]